MHARVWFGGSSGMSKAAHSCAVSCVVMRSRMVRRIVLFSSLVTLAGTLSGRDISAIRIRPSGPASNHAGQAEDDQQRQKAADIVKLVGITAVDHSTVFVRTLGTPTSTYIRDGTIHTLDVKRMQRSARWRCVGEAVSRDGRRLAYVTGSDDGQQCRLVVHDVETDRPRSLGDIKPNHVGHSVLCWSWDGSEIAYQELDGIFAMSIADGQRRLLARLPLPDARGQTLKDIVVHSLHWLASGSELLADISICLPIHNGEDCNYEQHVVLISNGTGRLLARGGNAALSPSGDRIAFVVKGAIEVMNLDGSSRRRIASVPRALFFFREDTGSGPLLWSPNGDRLWLTTVSGEETLITLYLIDVTRSTRRQIFRDSIVEILAWR